MTTHRRGGLGLVRFSSSSWNCVRDVACPDGEGPGPFRQTSMAGGAGQGRARRADRRPRPRPAVLEPRHGEPAARDG